MRKCLMALATLGFMPTGVVMAQSLPEPLKPIGNLSSPFNLIIPNYSEAPPVASWQGFHFKPSIGYNSVSFSGRGGSRLRNAKGLTLGVSGGYDFLYENFIFGPAGDIEGDFLRGGASSISNVPGYRTRINVDGSVRVRAGYLWDRTLLYVTGGYAFANFRIKNASLGLSNSDTLSGWTAGGGLEYQWNEHTSLRLEYRRVQFPTKSYESLPTGRNRVEFGMNKFDVGFVYRF